MCLRMSELEESVLTLKDSINNIIENILNNVEQLIKIRLKASISIRIKNIKTEVHAWLSSKEMVAIPVVGPINSKASI